MSLVLECQKCNNLMRLTDNKIKCDKCNNDFIFENNIIQCIKNGQDFNRKNFIDILISEIKQTTYANSIKEFVKKYPKYKTKLINPEFDQSVDNLIYGISNNERCLVIQNNFGNSVETLSKNFKQTISLNTKKKYLDFQNERFKNIRNNKIILIHSHIEKLYFPENYFDYIVFENITNDKEIIKNIIEEITRVLKPGGCFCITIKKEDIKLQKILDESSLKVRKFWSMQTTEIPTFSGEIDDEVGLKWYMKNIANFSQTKNSLKKQLVYWTLKNTSTQTSKLFKKKFVPSIIYCCFKNNISKTISNMIQKETGYNHYVVQSRPKKIVVSLINNEGIAEKIVHFNRFGDKIPSEIVTCKREFPSMNNPDSRLWMEDWYDGTNIDIENFEHVKKSLEWLKKFQNKTKQEIISENFINDEIEQIENKMLNYPTLNNDDTKKWIQDYKKFMKKNKFFNTAIHGDFWINNIIYNKNDGQINVIDWEKFKSKGNPFYDWMFFIIRIMTKTKNSSLSFEHFKKFLDINSSNYKQMKKIKIEMTEYFNCEFDLLLMLRIVLIKRILEKPYGNIIQDNNIKEIQIQMLQLLGKKNTLFD